MKDIISDMIFGKNYEIKNSFDISYSDFGNKFKEIFLDSIDDPDYRFTVNEQVYGRINKNKIKIWNKSGLPFSPIFKGNIKETEENKTLLVGYFEPNSLGVLFVILWLLIYTLIVFFWIISPENTEGGIILSILGIVYILIIINMVTKARRQLREIKNRLKLIK